jgi:copper chaperone CopZ
MAALETTRAGVTERYGVGGMTCGACASRVERALAATPGVRMARVDRAGAMVTVQRDPDASSFETLRQAVAAGGSTLAPTAEVPPRALPVGVGLLAALGLVAFYLGLITLAQGWAHAVQQLLDDLPFVGAIVAGFGAQVGLFTHLRALHARAAAGGVAASTGASTTAMLACCAHHLADILPILGLSGAAVFLNLYKTPLLWLGILMNLAGIVYLVRQIRRQRRLVCHTNH